MEKFNNVPALFEYLFHQLDEKGIEYFVTGSYALNVYTVPRMTRDIDIAVDLNNENTERFFTIFSEGFYLNKMAIAEDIKQQRMFNIIHEDLSFKLDFIPKKKTGLAEAEFRTKRLEKVLNSQAYVISPEHLFIAKLNWIQNTGSDYHIRDLQNLLFFPGINKVIIREWCEKLKLNYFGINL